MLSEYQIHGLCFDTTWVRTHDLIYRTWLRHRCYLRKRWDTLKSR